MAAFLLSGACGGSGAFGRPTGSPAQSGAPSSTGRASPSPSPGLLELAYRIQAGDTLGAIAERFGVTPESIIEANDLADPTALVVDYILKIPGVDPATAGISPASSPSSESPIGFRMIMPIRGACLSRDEQQLPNVPREYRHGVHEGVDFFTGFSCVDVPLGLPIVAPADGTVIRADHEFKQLTQRQIDELLALTAQLGYTDPGTLDKFRGRQVWIDHGDGIVTRYAHLSDIPQEVQVGTKVTEGQTIAFVGDSGTPESLAQAGYNKHLHFEIRVGNSFLGAGLSVEEARALYEAVFGLR